MDWLYIALLVGGVAFLILTWIADRSKCPFKLHDLWIDASTGKASLNAVIITGFALLSGWVVIVRVAHADVGTILLGVIGVFVGGRVVAQGISAFKPTNGKPIEEGKA